MNRLYIIALSLILLGISPTVAIAQVDDEVSMEQGAVTLAVRDGHAYITNAEGKFLEIYNLTGVRVAMIRIDANEKQISLNLARGCYILKVGKVVRKVTIL